MIIWAFNLLILAIGILVVGLIKPECVLFWWEEKQPTRLPIVIFCSVLIMAAAVMFGEGNRQGEPLSEVSPSTPSNTAKPVIDTPADLVEKSLK